MVRWPPVGAQVTIRYAAKPQRGATAAAAAWMPWHGRTATIVVRPGGGGRAPRNFGVRLEPDGRFVVVPAGNLVRTEAA